MSAVRSVRRVVSTRVGSFREIRSLHSRRPRELATSAVVRRIASPSAFSAGSDGSATWSRKRALGGGWGSIRASSSLPDDALYLPMPKLSPSMTTGKVTAWLKAEGDEINEYDAVMELSTDTLYAPGDADVEGAPVNMIVELAEAGYVGKLLVSEGDTVAVGQAVMIMCEEEESVDAMKKATSPGVDMYGDAGAGLRIATYQGYLNGITPEEE